MIQSEDVLASLEIMRENLRETLREASLLRRFAIEEEVLVGAENINKTCSNALRQAGQIRDLLSVSASKQIRRR